MTRISRSDISDLPSLAEDCDPDLNDVNLKAKSKKKEEEEGRAYRYRGYNLAYVTEVGKTHK
jgi:hypothetical protein